MIKQLYLSYRIFFLLAFSLVLIVALYLLFFKLGIVNQLPNDENLLQFDGKWFVGISVDGYAYTPDQQSNMAFFPLFPYIWKWSSLNAFNVSLLNVIIFLFSVALLFRKTQHTTMYILAIISLPCFAFFFVPYSESLFFLFGALLILGYQKNSRWLQFLGIFGCCLTRSAATVFIPAIIATELLAYKKSGITIKQLFQNILINTLACISSIFIVVVIQAQQTGKWFYYIEVQKYWKRHWLIPSVPFTLKVPSKILGMDAVALMAGLIAFFYCIVWIVKFIKDNIKNTSINNSEQSICKSVYFSAFFLAAIAIIDTCFTYNVGDRTSMRSMSRHVLCTAFAICFLNWINGKSTPIMKDIYMILTGLIIGIYITGVFEYPSHILYYVLFCSAFFLIKFFPKGQILLFIVFLLNVFFITIFYNDFLNERWIG